MTFEFPEIEEELEELRTSIGDQFTNGDIRAELLKKLLLLQTEIIGLHYSLMKAEQQNRFYFEEKDYLFLTHKWLMVRRKFRDIPRAVPKSLYEHDIVNSMHEVLSFHFDEMKSSWASSIVTKD